MTVEEIHDGIELGGIVVAVRQPDVQGTALALGGVDEIMLDDHGGSFLWEMNLIC